MEITCIISGQHNVRRVLNILPIFNLYRWKESSLHRGNRRIVGSSEGFVGMVVGLEDDLALLF